MLKDRPCAILEGPSFCFRTFDPFEDAESHSSSPAVPIATGFRTFDPFEDAESMVFPVSFHHLRCFRTFDPFEDAERSWKTARSARRSAVSEPSIRLRMLKGPASPIATRGVGSFRTFDPFEDAERRLVCGRDISTVCFRTFDPFEDAER